MCITWNWGVTGSYPTVHADKQNSGYVSDRVGGQRSRETFDTIWSFDTDGELRASPIVSDELVVLGDMDGTVYGLDAIDGGEHWRTELDAPSVFAAPAISDGTVFVSGFDDLNRTESTTSALDLSTGDVQWTRDFGQGGRTAVATDGERVYIPTHDGVCRALSVQTGETVWRLTGERHSKTPALSDGLVILDDGEDVVALDAECGTEQWRTALNGHVQTPVVVDEGRAYMITRSEKQWCLDATSGEVLWQIDIGETIREHPDSTDPLIPLGGGMLDSKPVTDGKSLFVGIYGGIVELDAVDGRLLGYHPLDQRVTAPLLVGAEGDRRVYGSVSNDGLIEYQLTSNTAVQRRSTTVEILNTVPAYAAGVFYVTTDVDGMLAVT